MGAGPTGLALACCLAESGHKVTVFEKEPKAGGGWVREIDESGRVYENSPRVLVGNHSGFFADLGVKFDTVYGNFIASNLKILAFLWKHLTIRDFIILFWVYPPSDMTLKQWMEINQMSEAGRTCVRKLSILVNDVPEKTNAQEFYRTITSVDFAGIRQFRDADDWVNKALQRIRSFPDCNVFVNANVTSLVATSGSQAVHAVVVDGQRFPADRVVLCTQATGLLPILENTPFVRNWEKLTRQWVDDTSYFAFGFQIHFKGSWDPPAAWCWSCSGPWTVIALRVGTKTLSCCVVDMDSPSDVTNLSVNMMSNKDDIVAECMRQMYGQRVPDNIESITFSPGLEYIGHWVSRYTGFTAGTHGRLPMKGLASNLFALGCFTDIGRPRTAQTGTAIEAVVVFLKKYEPHAHGFHVRYPIRTALIVIITVFLLFLVVKFQYHA